MKSPLESLGLDQTLVNELNKKLIPLSGNYEKDADSCIKFWQSANQLLEKLPPKFKRTTEEHKAALFILEISRARRDDFLHLHVQTVYKKITHNLQKFIRLEEGEKLGASGYIVKANSTPTEVIEQVVKILEKKTTVSK